MTLAQLSDRLLAPMDRLVARMTDPVRRERTVVVILLAYVAVWTLYGVLAKASQDVHPDMSELFAWSQQPALGYDKHPPLAAWLATAWFALFPATDWSFMLLAMAVAGVALWLAWRLAGDYLDAECRVLALTLLMLVPFFNFQALKYNANTVLLPMWAATALCFLRSYERRAASWAALAGICAAGAMLGKYWSIFLLMGLGIAALIDRRRGAYFRSAAPWTTIAVGGLALAPHVMWLVTNDFAPFVYAADVHVRSVALTAKSVIGYLAGSVGYVALPVVLALATVRPTRAALADMQWPSEPARRLVVLVFWLPLLLPAAVAPIGGAEITSLWSMSAWTLLPVVLLSSPLIKLHRPAFLTVVALAVVLPPIMVAVAPGIAIRIHRNNSVPPAMVHSHLLAERIAHEWRRATDRPLRLVSGDSELAYGVAFYLASRPLVLLNFDPRTAPRSDWPGVRRDGIAIVCDAERPRCGAPVEAQDFAGEQIEVEMARSHFGGRDVVGWYRIVIVPPQR